MRWPFLLHQEVKKRPINFIFKQTEVAYWGQSHLYQTPLLFCLEQKKTTTELNSIIVEISKKNRTTSLSLLLPHY